MSLPDKRPLTGAEESIAFYYYLGRSITAWAHVEQSLYWVASSSFPSKSRDQFAATFFSIENFRSKLSVANRLFRLKRKSAPHIKAWEALMLEIEKLSKLRNHLAHYPAMNYPNAPPGHRVALIPRFVKPNKYKQKIPKPPSEAICLREIIHAGDRFIAMAFALEFLFYRLERRTTPLPASLAQAKNAPNLAELTLQIRAVLPLPREPFDG